PSERERVRGPVSLERALGDEPVGRALGAASLWRLASGARVALREHIRQQHVVLLAQRVQRLAERNEVARDQPGSLMDQLIKGVLTVGAGLAPIDRAGFAGDGLAIERHMLSVALHGQLLEIGGK